MKGKSITNLTQRTPLNITCFWYPSEPHNSAMNLFDVSATVLNSFRCIRLSSSSPLLCINSGCSLVSLRRSDENYGLMAGFCEDRNRRAAVPGKSVIRVAHTVEGGSRSHDSWRSKII